MVTINGIQYYDALIEAGPFDGFKYPHMLVLAVEQCRNGSAQPADQTEQPISDRQAARIAVLAKWHLCATMPDAGRSTYELTKAKLLGYLLTGNPAIICTPNTETQRDRVVGALTTNLGDPHAGMYAAIGYILYAVDRALYTDSIEANLRNLEREILPDTVECCHCNEDITTSENRFARWASHRNRLDRRGTRFIHQACIDRNYVLSRAMSEYLLSEDEDLVDVQGDVVTLHYAETNYYYDEDNEEWLTERPEPADSLHSYSTNPFNFHVWDQRNAENALVFGVELEMEPTRGNSSGDLVEALGGSSGNRDEHFILKSDGSLSDGVELVTMPFTLEQHKDPNGKMPWVKVLERVRGMAKSGANTDHCGIHIHINKKALSALTIGKMLVFLNSETLSPLISTIAQRGSGSYCVRDSNKKITDGAIARGQNRYDIMNISVSHPTCEVRMFRGNLRPERVLKNIEFCHALVQYSRQTAIQDMTDWGNFSRWLLKNRGTYDNLVKFLIDKNTVGFRQARRESNEFHTYAMIEEA